MTRGHIGMGAPGAIQEYILAPRGDGVAWDRGPANPFAAKVQTTGEYDKIDAWNEWVQEDWQAGVGRVNPQEGGFLFSEVETRVPRQVILPVRITQADFAYGSFFEVGAIGSQRNMPGYATGELIVGSGANAKVAIYFTASVSAAAVRSECELWLYAEVPAGVTVTVEVCADSAGVPGTVLATSSRSGQSDVPGYRWVGPFDHYGSGTLAQPRWIVVSASGGQAKLACGPVYVGPSQTKLYNSGAWAADTDHFPFYTSNVFTLLASSSESGPIIRFNGALQVTQGKTIYPTNASYALVAGSGLAVTYNVQSLCVFDGKLYIGTQNPAGPEQPAFSWSGSGAAAAAGNGKLFTVWNGYLWKAYQNDLYYSNDGTTWTGPLEVPSDSYEIRGMAGMGEYLYVSTDEALYYVAPGNVVVGVMPWGSVDVTNGAGMINHGGSLYIPVHGRLFRYSTSGDLMDVWISKEEDLPSNRIGQIQTLVSMNNWLTALVLSEDTDALPSIWIYQDEGWHHLATLPGATSDIGFATTRRYGMYFDRETSHLWVQSNNGTCYRAVVTDYAVNPYNDTARKYMPHGWLEQGKFFGGQYLLDKDWESVTVVGDLAAGQTVKVYWQEAGDTSWSLLGTADSDGEELRWSDYSTRPQGKWIRLGLLLTSTTQEATPRVRAVIVKFLPMANDRVRDTVVVKLGNHELLDTVETRSLATQYSNLMGTLVRGRVHPLIYRDPLGVYYECHVVDYGEGISRYAAEGSPLGTVKEMDIRLTLEQVPDGTYTP